MTYIDDNSFLVCLVPQYGGNNGSVHDDYYSIPIPYLRLPATRSINDHCILQRHKPPASIFMLYAFVVPVLAGFGLCANLINAIVFMRPKMTPSAFTYLAALSCLDCLSCLLITLTAMSRSYFCESTAWLTYDYQWQTPLFGMTTGAANLILACVSFDRLVYLSRFARSNGAPPFCRRRIARGMVAFVIFVSVFVNIPYFFVFVVNVDGSCQVTDFYYSSFYKIHNWFTFILLAILPAVFLTVGNLAIIIVFRRWTKQSKRCQRMCNNGNSATTQKRYKHQMKLTVTILIVITLYMIGELPAHLTSRKSALNLLFNGDVNKVNIATMERMEIICITLNALQLSINILVYAVINPSFMPEFFKCLRSISDVCLRCCCCFSAIKCKCCCRKRSIMDDNDDIAAIDCNDVAAADNPSCAATAKNASKRASLDIDDCWSTASISKEKEEKKCNSSSIFATPASAVFYDNACFEFDANKLAVIDPPPSKSDDDEEHSSFVIVN